MRIPGGILKILILTVKHWLFKNKLVKTLTYTLWCKYIYTKRIEYL